MTTRKRKQEKQYQRLKKNRPKSDDCSFCLITQGHEEFIEEGAFFKIITNRFHYSYWDEQEVQHQVMLVPKEHIDSISKLPLKAAEEFLEYISKYEEQGYSVYARPPQSVTKTITHQHTHLIKTDGKRKKTNSLLPKAVSTVY